MDYFEITLRGMRKVLDLCGEDTYRAYIDDCIEGYSAKGDVGLLMKGFSPKGVFADFHFENTVFLTEEKRFWTEQLFGGLGQTLTIRHDSLNRESFMPGVCLAAKSILGHKGLIIGLDKFMD